MPELPDVTVYIEALDARIRGLDLIKVRLASPFVLRTFDPPIRAAEGRRVAGLRRVGKRIALRLVEGAAPPSPADLFLVIHLMIAGRLRWVDPGAKIPGKLGLAAFDFAAGTLILTEAASKKRASIHLLRGEESLRAIDRGGLEVLEADLPAFRAALAAENHTLKRALTDPTLFSGIGNAYSDEILHRARLSPAQLTQKLDADKSLRLYEATRAVLVEWTERLREEAGGAFPAKVTAFRPQMAVHGKFRQPCPVCGTAVQRIAYADNETNYGPRCQTGGRLLSDRGLARLLKEDWPRSIAELEERMPSRAPPPR
ncbi:MAG: Fpg/Nei family DNA glycosylase [Myxococcales bacterium]